jgi:hypothetical protein
MMAFFTIKAMVGQQAGRNYPAPVKVVEVIEAARGMGLEDALAGGGRRLCGAGHDGRGRGPGRRVPR